MQPWQKRVVEEANLFNPVFCGVLVVKTVEAFKKKSGHGLSFPLAFLILPILLHKGTREALPATTITSLLPWLQDNRSQLIEFPERVRRLELITKEAMMFDMTYKTLVIDEHGNLVPGKKRLNPTSKLTDLTLEAQECLERASFLGRWFAAAGTTTTIMASWGVSP